MSDEIDVKTEDDISDVVFEYLTLVVRAMDVVEDAPYWKSVAKYHGETARLTIGEDGSATLTWQRATTDYDSPVLEAESVTFPASLLLMNDAARKVWKVEERAKYDAEQRARAKRDQEQLKVNTEQQERAVLAALKAKYESKQNA